MKESGRAAGDGRVLLASSVPKTVMTVKPRAFMKGWRCWLHCILMIPPLER